MTCRRGGAALDAISGLFFEYTAFYVPTVKYDPSIHHRRSIRLSSYDYRTAGAYFVTLCTYERACILDDAGFGVTVEASWAAIPDHFQGAAVDEFIVMPNHLNGIVLINDGVGATALPRPETRPYDRQPSAVPPEPPIGRGNPSPLRERPRGPDPCSLGAIIGSFKAFTTRRIDEIRGTPGAPVWQRNYYERVIRNDRELDAVRQYIRDNPAKWAEDPNNPA